MSVALRITGKEWEIMRVVWEDHPITASQIILSLGQQDPTWHPKTVRTLLSRLVKKKALDYKPIGRAYVYEPKVSESECVSAVSASFLDRVFGGSLQPMLAHFVQQKALTKREIQELKRILENPERLDHD